MGRKANTPEPLNDLRVRLVNERAVSAIAIDS